MTDPALVLAVVMVLLLTAYVLLGGADYGAGVWDLLATGDTAASQRATLARAIAPVWEANHVWLIVVVTILFNAFPSAFARLSIGLHVPIALALLGIVLRGSAFVFRAYGAPESRAGRRWGHVFAGASTITPLLLGVIVGAVTEGRTATAEATFRGQYVDPWLTPFALAVGVFAVVLFSFLAAVYLTIEAAEAATAEAFRRRALGAALLTGVLALVVFVLADDLPHVRRSLVSAPWSVPLHLATAAAALAAIAALMRRRYRWARVAAAAQASLILWGWALAQYPYLLRPDLTIEAAAAPRPVLVLLLQILGVGAIVLLPSLYCLFAIFDPARPSRKT